MARKTVFGYLLVLVVVPVVLLLGMSSVGAQQGDVDWDAVQISTHHARGSVHFVEGRGGNIGLSVGDDGVIMEGERNLVGN